MQPRGFREATAVEPLWRFLLLPPLGTAKGGFKTRPTPPVRQRRNDGGHRGSLSGSGNGGIKRAKLVHDRCLSIITGLHLRGRRSRRSGCHAERPSGFRLVGDLPMYDTYERKIRRLCANNGNLLGKSMTGTTTQLNDMAERTNATIEDRLGLLAAWIARSKRLFEAGP